MLIRIFNLVRLIFSVKSTTIIITFSLLLLSCIYFNCYHVYTIGWEQVWGGEYIEPLPYDRPLDDEADLAREERLLDTFEDNNRSFYEVEKSIPRADGTIYDNPNQSAVVLRGLWWAHGELLRDVPIQFPEALNKYFSALDSFGEAYDRVKSLQGREKMSFVEVRQVVEDDEIDEESEEIDEMILRHFKYDSSFRRTYDIMSLVAVLTVFNVIHYLYSKTMHFLS